MSWATLLSGVALGYVLGTLVSNVVIWRLLALAVRAVRTGEAEE